MALFTAQDQPYTHSSPWLAMCQVSDFKPAIAIRHLQPRGRRPRLGHKACLCYLRVYASSLFSAAMYLALDSLSFSTMLPHHLFIRTSRLGNLFRTCCSKRSQASYLVVATLPGTTIETSTL